MARMWKKRMRRLTMSMKRQRVAQEHMMMREMSHCGRPWYPNPVCTPNSAQVGYYHILGHPATTSWHSNTRYKEGEQRHQRSAHANCCVTCTPQSAPPQPGEHSHAPVTHMPCPEHMLRSAHSSIGRTVSDRHILQQLAGAMGTNCPILVILLQEHHRSFKQI